MTNHINLIKKKIAKNFLVYFKFLNNFEHLDLDTYYLNVWHMNCKIS